VTTLDPNLERIEVVASALGSLRNQVVLVGGCAAGLLISDPAATPIRATLDVDLVVHVTVLTEYHRIENEFVQLGFKRDMAAEAPICRWVYRNTKVDLMPAKPDIIGFSNRWYSLAIETAQTVTLPSGVAIRLVSAEAFLGTKFEAFVVLLTALRYAWRVGQYALECYCANQSDPSDGGGQVIAVP